MKRFVLIDGHSLLFRAYHALPKTFTDETGHPVNAIYGFMSMLIRVANDLKPDYLVVAFDEKGPTFRHQELVTYKQGRPEMDTELQEQQPIVREMLKSFSIPFFSVEGYEGEDVIATVINKVKSAKGQVVKRAGSVNSQMSIVNSQLEVFIVSGDRDVLQLVSQGVKVYSPRKGLSDPVIYDESNVAEVFGVPAGQITDFKGLRGDSSDRIPGVFGIGEKTAVQLIKEFGTVEDIYRHIAEVRARFGESVEKKLIEGAEQAVLSKRLATIVGDAPVTIDLSLCIFHDLGTRVAGLEFLSRLRFRSLIKRLTGSEEIVSERKKKPRKTDKVSAGQAPLL